MYVNSMTKKEFEQVPRAEWDEEIICDSLIVIPGDGRSLHDSGYRSMSFVAVNDNEPFALLSGCSDVIHIEGVGGYGDKWLEKYGTVPLLIPPSGWSIDCLPKSGLLRLFNLKGNIKCGRSLSSFEVYSVKEESTCTN